MGIRAFVLGWNSSKKTKMVLPGPDGMDLLVRSTSS